MKGLTKKTIALLVSASLFLTAGCGKGGGETAGNGADSPSPSEETVKLVFWESDNNETDETLEKQQALFDQIKEETGIEIEFTRLPFASYDDKCNTALSSKTGPDIIAVNGTTLGTFAQKGYLVDIGDYLDSSTKLSRDDFAPGLWGNAMLDGVVYGLPRDTGTRALLYNKTELDQAGMTLGDEVTWEEFKEAAALLTQDTDGDGVTDKFGFGYAGGNTWALLHEALATFAIQTGEDIFTEDGRPNVNCEGMKKAVALMKELEEMGACPKDSVTTTDGNLVTEMFLAGTVGMIQSNLGGYRNIMNKNPEFEVGMALLKESTIGSSLGGWTLAVSQKAEDPEVCFKVLEYLCQPENIVLFTSSMPAVLKANEDTLADPEIKLFADVLPYSKVPIPTSPTVPEAAKILQNHFQNIIMGTEEVEAGMDAAQEEIMELMGLS